MERFLSSRTVTNELTAHLISMVLTQPEPSLCGFLSPAVNLELSLRRTMKPLSKNWQKKNARTRKSESRTKCFLPSLECTSLEPNSVFHKWLWQGGFWGNVGQYKAMSVWEWGGCIVVERSSYNREVGASIPAFAKMHTVVVSPTAA